MGLTKSGRLNRGDAQPDHRRRRSRTGRDQRQAGAVDGYAVTPLGGSHVESRCRETSPRFICGVDRRVIRRQLIPRRVVASASPFRTLLKWGISQSCCTYACEHVAVVHMVGRKAAVLRSDSVATTGAYSVQSCCTFACEPVAVAHLIDKTIARPHYRVPFQRVQGPKPL
jgi:hypothetical protein